MPSATPSPPIQLASRWLAVDVRAYCFNLLCHLCVGSASPCGAMMASNPSLAGSFDDDLHRLAVAFSIGVRQNVHWISCDSSEAKEIRPARATESGESAVSFAAGRH